MSSSNDSKPIAIRIVRPYESEEAWFENELETMTRSSLILVGASAREPGVVLRFEVTLSTGKPVLRGEGKVLEYVPPKTAADPGLSGLMIRFTKLDPKSKQTVDAAHAKRNPRPALAVAAESEEKAPESVLLPEPERLSPVPASSTLPLERLRAHAQGLSSEAIQSILETGTKLRGSA
jgi:hypothetical protein